MKLQDIVCGTPAMKIQEMINTWYQKSVGSMYRRPKPYSTTQKIGGALTYANAGLYTNCFKLDVSSLYPSVMLRYEIDPGTEKDPDHAFLALLKCITDERLALKELGKQDPDAKIREQSLKILINSFYGLLGSGQPHNNPDSAEKVTAYGRKILTLMINVLEKAGVTVAEADTDGVLCALGSDTTDPIQHLNQVNAALPEGIKVELEWVMPWVYIHAPKNYILYDGSKHIFKGLFHKRDQPALLKEFVTNFINFALISETDAISYYNKVLGQIRSGTMPIELLTVKKKHSKTMVNFSHLGKIGDKISFYIGTDADGKEANVNTGPYDVLHYVKYIDKLMVTLMKNIFKEDFVLDNKYPTRRKRKYADADSTNIQQ